MSVPSEAALPELSVRITLAQPCNERGDVCGAELGGTALGVGPARCFPHELAAFQAEKS